MKLYNQSVETSTQDVTLYSLLAANAGMVELATWNHAAALVRWAGDAAQDGGTDAGCTQSGTDYNATALGTFQNIANTVADTLHEITLNVAQVQAWVDGGNYGIVMFTDTANTIDFHSDDAATEALRPVIEITYRPNGGGDPAGNAQWLLNDNAANAVVTGTIGSSTVNGFLVGGDTQDVYEVIDSHGSFHLDGSTQFVQIEIDKTLVRPDEVSRLWTKYASNPVLVAALPSSQLAPKPGGGWWLFCIVSDNVHRWESTDLITWSNETEVFVKAAPGAWDEALDGFLPFQKTDGSWLALYRGGDAGNTTFASGLATSADGTTWTRKDNGGVDDGLFPQFGSNYDPFCVVLVGTTWYVYTNGVPDHEHINLYTSVDDFATFTPYAGNPIFNNGFCPFVWKYGSYYYMLVNRDLGARDTNWYEHVIALYRCADPIFDPDGRQFLGNAIVNDSPLDYRYLDTPTMPFTDARRDTYAAEFGSTLYVIYTGGYTTNMMLASTTFAALSALSAIPENETEIYHTQARTYDFNMQFDSLADGMPIFSIGANVSNSRPVQAVTVKGVNNNLNLWLDSAYRATTQLLAINTPYHVVIVDDVGETRVYVDDVLVGTFAFENSYTDANVLYVGRNASAYLDGYVWDFRIIPGAADA
jgi:hypothetical protein